MLEKGFLASLFDMSFSDFVTIRIIKLLYTVGIVLAGITGLIFIVSGFVNGIGTGILFLLLSPFVVMIYILMTRIWLELIIVVFRIAENTSQLVKMQKKVESETRSESNI